MTRHHRRAKLSKACCPFSLGRRGAAASRLEGCKDLRHGLVPDGVRRGLHPPTASKVGRRKKGSDEEERRRDAQGAWGAAAGRRAADASPARSAARLIAHWVRLRTASAGSAICGRTDGQQSRQGAAAATASGACAAATARRRRRGSREERRRGRARQPQAVGRGVVCIGLLEQGRARAERLRAAPGVGRWVGGCPSGGGKGGSTVRGWWVGAPRPRRASPRPPAPSPRAARPCRSPSAASAPRPPPPSPPPPSPSPAAPEHQRSVSAPSLSLFLLSARVQPQGGPRRTRSGRNE